MLQQRVLKEQRELEQLMGWDTNQFQTIDEFLAHDSSEKRMSASNKSMNPHWWIPFIALLTFAGVHVVSYHKRRKELN